MEKLYSLEYYGVPCHFRYLQKSDVKKERSDIKCIVTGKPLTLKEGFFIIINNGKLFPNVFISTNTVEEWGYIKCVEVLSNEWNEVENLKKSTLLKKWGLQIVND